jgi:two-component system sensor kinase FixL
MGDGIVAGGAARPLAWHLGALCAVLLAPNLLLGALMLFRGAAEERARHEAMAREASRTVATALDRGLATYGVILEVLATSDHLGGGDLEGFRRRAFEAPRPPGSEIALRGPALDFLTGTVPPFPAAPAEAAAARRAAETGRPQVSGRLDPPPPGVATAFSVVAPVRGDHPYPGATLALLVPVQVIERLLREGDVPPGMTAAILDSSGAALAVLGDEDRLPQGGFDAEWQRAPSRSGEEVVATAAQSELSRWTVVVALPERDFAAPLRRSLVTAVALALLLIALAATAALAFARRIARPIEALAGHDSAGPSVRVQEVDAVAAALAEAREAARRREAEREALLDTLDLGQVMVREPGGAIALWTCGMERLFGWSAAEALGRLSHELLATEFPEPLARIEAELLDRGEWRGELHQRRKDGSAVTVAAHWALRRAPDGRAIAVVEACSDITALRAAEGKLRETQAELFRVARLNSMGAMAAAIAHELNQPLAAASNFAEAASLLLQDEDRPLDSALAALREASAEIVRAGSTLSRLREFIGRGDTEKRAVEVNALVRRAATLALVGAAPSGVSLRLELDPGAPVAFADPVQLQQVVVNLVRNAAEATRPMPCREVTVGTAARAGAVEVSVADTGPGLAAELRDRLFQPFVTTKPDGMGIGLAISRSIVEGHGGTLTAAPRHGGGAVFRFTLPAARGLAHAA